MVSHGPPDGGNHGTVESVARSLCDREAAFIRQLNSPQGAFHSPSLHAYPNIAAGWAFRISIPPRDKGNFHYLVPLASVPDSLPFFISIHHRAYIRSSSTRLQESINFQLGKKDYHRQTEESEPTTNIIYFWFYFLVLFLFVHGGCGTSDLTCQRMEFRRRTRQPPGVDEPSQSCA